MCIKNIFFLGETVKCCYNVVSIIFDAIMFHGNDTQLFKMSKDLMQWLKMSEFEHEQIEAVRGWEAANCSRYIRLSNL